MEDRRIRKLGRRGGATLLTLGLALGGFSLFAPMADAAAGNNGTVKINGTDISVANDPHVACLQAVWYGFDLNATVTKFDVTFVNPTPAPVVQHFANQITLQSDAAGGSADFDGSFVPAIDTTGIAPNNKGEWHVDISIDTTSANGNSISKTKTVWITNQCPTAGDSQATIQVSKAVVGTLPAGVTTFPFTVTCSTGSVLGGAFDLADGAGSTATVSWDPAGAAPTCTVTETDTRGATSTTHAVDGGAATNGAVATVATLVDGSNRVVAFTNTYANNGGGCQVNCNPIPVVIDIPTTTVPTPTTTEAPRVEPEVIVPTTVPTQVEGVQVVAPAPPPAQVQPAQLARTGAMTDHLIVAAGLCLLLGGVVLTASKERTAVPTRRR